MSASISMKRKNVGLDFLKRTTGIIAGATGGYISETMPTSSSTISEARNTISSVNSTFINSSQSVMPKIRQLRTQISFKNIMNWYMQKEDDFSGGMNDADMQFDISTDSVELAEAQITELDKNANKISQAVVESSHKLAESQIAATANLLATTQNQTAVISAGFDKTNETLNKILEVLTKNTSTLIETTVAAASSNKNANEGMLSSGKFDLGKYKEIVKNNFNNSEYGTMAAMIGAFANPQMAKHMLTPEFFAQGIISKIIDKKSPNLKKNLEALDKAVSDTIMTSLIRLGENNKLNFGGQIARIFGIDSSRKDVDTSRSSIELKAVPFDSIAHESITNTIPGYLRKILVAVGGEDVVYDYRSRTFKSKGSIKKEFHESTVSTNTIYGASSRVKRAMGEDDFGSMIYDLMMTELGSRTQNGSARQTITKMSNPIEAEKYILNTILAQVGLSPEELKRARQIAPNLAKAIQNGGNIDIMNQAARTNVQRNMRKSNYVKNADNYNIDLSEIRDSYDNDIETILQEYGKNKGKRKSGATSIANPKTNLVDINYSNMALYEIYRKLNEGINVFQVGSNAMRSEPFKKRGDDYLTRPQTYKPRPLSDNISGAITQHSLVNAPYDPDDTNLLENQEFEDGSSENLTKGQRFKRWGKRRGGNIMQAIFSGNPEQIKNAFGIMFKEAGQTGAGFAKNQFSKINEGNGNITGYLKHKITGSGYKYINDDGKEVEIGKNEKGGMLGYFDDILFGPGGHKKAMKDLSSKSSKWFKSVSGYFNFASKDPDEQKVEGSRKRILGTSVGAMLGMGMVGGPLGIIMGGIAGSALSQTNGIGDKIKKMLFGDKDHEGDKRKDRNKRRGLIGRAVDNIVDPIRYQIGKTMTTFGSVMKKNIIGPLSNIGVAIKERMANSAGGVVSKFFGKIFGGMGSTIKKLLMIPLNIVKAPITAVGNLSRGAIRTSGGIVGGGLNSFAKTIAGKDNRDIINQRIQSQRNDANIDEAESGYFGEYEFDYEQDPNGPRGRMIKTAKRTSKKRGYKSWKEQQDIARDKMHVGDYTKETTVAIKDVAESNSEIAEDVSTLAHLGSEKGSIFTHDDGLHTRIDKIIDIISNRTTGMKSTNNGSLSKNTDSSILFDKMSKDNERDSFASSAIPGAMSLIVSGDEVGDNESRLASGIIDDAAKPNSRKESISTKLKDLMRIQKKKSENGDKKETLFDKIFNFLGDAGNVLKSLIPLGGIIALFYGLFKNGGLTDLLERVGTSTDKVINLFDENSEESKDPTTAGMNAVTALGDAQVNSSWDWVNPFANINHNETNGAGDSIKNSAVTDAKNAPVKWSLTKDILGNTWGSIKQSRYSDKAIRLSAQADAYRMDGANVRADLTQARANNAQKTADAGAAQSTAPKTNTVKTVGRNVARVGIINTAGGLAENLGSGIASAVGANEETSATVGRLSNAAASSALIINTASSALKPGKKAWVDKIIDGVTKLIKFIAEKIGADKSVKRIGSSKIISTLTSTTSKIIGSLKTKIDDVFIDKVEAKLAALGVKNAATAATAGIAIAVGAVAGLASGFCGTEHLFGVLPGDADAGMKTISSLFGAAFGALEMTPAGWVVCILDIIDGVLTSIPGIGVGIKQFLARSLYKLFGGSENLEEKQAKMEADRQYLKDTYGVELNAATHNDEINNAGLIDRMWSGKAKLDENDHVIRDDAGAVLKQGGIKSWFVGNERQYEKDESGAVIRDDEGNAIQAVDKYGEGIKKDKKWGDYVGGFFSSAGRFFGGSTEYETDENGQAIRDENGEYIVKEKKGNILQRAGSAISSGYTSLKSKASDVIGSAGKKLSSIKDSAFNTVKNVGSSIASGAKNVGKGVLNFFGFGSSNTEKDVENELDSEVKKDSKLKDFIGNSAKAINTKGIGGIFKAAASTATSVLTNPIKSIADGINDINDEKYVTDEKGNTIKNIGSTQKLEKGKLGDFLKNGINKITAFVTNPIKELSDGVDEWSDKESPWKKDGKTSIASWVGDKVGGFWSNIIDGLKSLEKEPSSIGGPYRVGGPVSEIAGGNPLSKNFAVTSGFGKRANVGDYHSGVDLIPQDNSEQADVMSRFNGKIISVKDDVSNSDTGLKYQGKNSGGNEVVIQTDDGIIIRNNHLKQGSIPSNIKPGTIISEGQKIGEMGSTGRSSGSHLHYEMEAPDGKGHMIPYNPLGKRIGGFIKSTKKRIGTAAGSEFTRWIKVVKEVKANFAAKKLGYSQARWTSITADGYEINMRTDCSGFVSACVSCFSKKKMMESTSSMENENHKILREAGFTRYNWPGWEGLYQGDIIVRSGHTEIFSHMSGNTPKVWNCGSDSSCNNPEPTDDKISGKYSTVWRHKSSNGASVDPTISAVTSSDSSYTTTSADTTTSATNGGGLSGFISAISNFGNKLLYNLTGGLIGNNGDTESGSTSSFSSSADTGYSSPVVDASYASSADIGPGTENLWKYFKSLGYSDNECAGVLGCWTSESGNSPKRVEWDYSDTFKNMLTYDAVATDRDKVDAFTQALFNKYSSQGMSINQNAYKGSDGHLYPGIGYAQWTGGRGQALLDFANANNLKWYDSGTQLSYLDTELKSSSYSGVRSAMQATNSPEEAAGVFCSKFEGYSGPNVSQRKSNARALMSQYGGKYDTNVSIGGPINLEDQSQINFNNDFNDDFRIGGPIEEDAPVGLNSSSFAPSRFTSFNKSAGNTKSNPFSTATATTKNYAVTGLGTTNLSGGLFGSSGTGIESSGSTDRIQELIIQIISELKNIASNTGQSNSLLTNLGQPSSESSRSNSSGKIPVNRNYAKRHINNGNNSRAITAMARP